MTGKKTKNKNAEKTRVAKNQKNAEKAKKTDNAKNA